MARHGVARQSTFRKVLEETYQDAEGNLSSEKAWELAKEAQSIASEGDIGRAVFVVAKKHGLTRKVKGA